jgi:hypothetical protein
MVIICPQCSRDPPQDIASQEQHDPPGEKGGLDARTRFRRLLKQHDESFTAQELPDELLEDLPPDTKELLKLRLQPPASGAAEKLSEDRIHYLRQQGYIVDQDAHGIRIGGRLIGTSSYDRGLSSSDIVRLAAELNGGVPSPSERKYCPKCEAMLPLGETRCQWCGIEIPDAASDSEEAGNLPQDPVE